METLDLKIVAATAGLVEGFQPATWTSLHDPRGRRILVSDGERSVVAALLTGEEIAVAESENLGAAVLRGLLPHSTVAFPQVIASAPVPSEQFDSEAECEVRVSAPLPGTPASNTAFAASDALVESLAAFLAELHDADPDAIADSGLAVQAAAEVRQSLLDDLDRGAATGRVPAVLLQRWESALENVATWRFLPCPVHGSLSEDAIRTADDSVTAVSDLGQLQVGDPAADLAAVSALLDPDTLEKFFRAYRRLRQVSDPGLRTRIEVLAELSTLDWLLEAVHADDEAEIADAAGVLASLAELTVEEAQPRPAVPYESESLSYEIDEPSGIDESNGGSPVGPPAEPVADSPVAPPAETPAGESATADAGLAGDRGSFRPTAPVVDEEAAAAVPTERIDRPDGDTAGFSDDR